MDHINTAVLHYSAPPVVGGVEAVIQAHIKVMLEAGYPATVIAGRGDQAALPQDAELIFIPEIDSQHEAIARINPSLEQGSVPPDFENLASRLEEKLAPVVTQFDALIVHNVFTKHFNLPLTAALSNLLDAGTIRHCIAWCHDISWTSPNSRSKVHPGYPWDLLRAYRPEIAYVAVSSDRQRDLARLFGCSPEKIQVIYNGVDPQSLLGLTQIGFELVNRLGLFEAGLVLIMPVRVTQAKNIEYALQVLAVLKDKGISPRLILTGPPDPHDPQSMDYYRQLLTLRSQLRLDEEMRFIFESGPDHGQPYTIEPQVVGDLLRMSDIMFMPSHREGFGMPVLEAGLAGIQVISTGIPAAKEIGGEDIIQFSADESPEQVAVKILDWTENSPLYRLKKRVRQKYTWKSIFQNQIRPLLQPGENT